jgi:methanogenic corrinoid protein MtbC1
LATNADLSAAYFENLLRLGFPVSSLFTGILVPSARRLGELWDRDLRDFTEVARGMDHIQQIVLAHCSMFTNELHVASLPRRILLMPLPNEGHRFGLLLIRAQFWRAGWDVSCDIPESIDDLVRLVKKTPFDVVGISACAVRDVRSVARDVSRIRKASRNRELVVLVGGQAFVRDPNLVAAIGADATAADGRDAVERMNTLLQNRLRQPG